MPARPADRAHNSPADTVDVDGWPVAVTCLYPPGVAADLYEALATSLAWAQHHVTVYGVTHPQPRLSAWMGPGPYRYAGLTLPAADFPTVVAEIAADVARCVGEPFDAVLANWYRDGRDAMGYHADDEPELGADPLVAAVSFGATRTLRIRPRTGGPSTAVPLAGGDLVVLPRGLQRTHHHAIPRTRRPVGGRISLTFRQYRPHPPGGPERRTC